MFTNQRITILGAGLFALLSWAQLHAETVYVSDQLVITLRSAPEQGAEIISHLRTGDALELLERPETGNFLRVRTAAGDTGWVLSQYVMPDPAARLRLPRLQENLSRSRAELAAAAARMDALEEELAEKTTALQQTTTALAQQSQELDEIREASAGALALDARNSELTQTLQAARSEVRALQLDNAQLQSQSRRQWFLTGAGVLSGGIIFGWILARLIRRKRWEW